MKKLVLLTLEYPPDLGGVAEYLYGLWNALPPSVATGVVQVRLEQKPFAWLRALPTIAREVYAYKPQGLVISHILPMGYVALLLGQPYVVIVHGTDLKRAKATAWKKFWATVVMRYARLVVANSEYVAELAKSFGISNKKLQVIHPCVLPHEKVDLTVDVGGSQSEERLFEPHRRVPRRTEWHARSGGQVLLSVCRLVKRKGIDQVLHVLPALLKKFPMIRYVVAGSGSEEQNLKTLAKELGISEFVEFTGAVEMEERDRLYDQADIFVLPGSELHDDVEGFGIVFLEAAMHAIPSVAGRSGGSAEAVIDGKTGLMVDSSDPESLEAAIESLLLKPEIAHHMGEAGRERVLAEFMWDKQAHLLFERLKTL